MTFKKRADEARIRFVALIDSSGDETQRAIREDCLAIFDRWLAGDDVDLTLAMTRANPTDRDDIVPPMLDVLSELHIIGGRWWI